MKPTKKKTAKKRDPRDPILSKLIDLKYRINEAYRGYPHETNKNDKDWVISQISALREGFRMSRGNMLHANNLWKEYQGSRMNNWESCKDNYTTPSSRGDNE